MQRARTVGGADLSRKEFLRLGGAALGGGSLSAQPPDLRRTPVRPEATVTSGGDHELQVHLRAPGGYAYFVHLSVPDEATRFSDNYFDLEPD
jgi:hypothetical protein